MRWTAYAGFAVLILSSGSALAETNKPNAEFIEATFPVFEGDVDRPYVVVGEIKDNLRKHFAFQSNPKKEKIYAELWERARKMGADAVIKATFGATVGTPFNHGRTPISGIAIKYVNEGSAAR